MPRTGACGLGTMGGGGFCPQLNGVLKTISVDKTAANFDKRRMHFLTACDEAGGDNSGRDRKFARSKRRPRLRSGNLCPEFGSNTNGVLLRRKEKCRSNPTPIIARHELASRKFVRPTSGPLASYSILVLPLPAPKRNRQVSVMRGD